MKGMRVAGATTLEQANHYLETEFLPWVNATLAVVPASADDAHRPLEKQHDLAAILSHVESRRVNNDYTIQLDSQDLPDRAPGHPHRTARRCRAGREAAGRFGGSSIPRSLPERFHLPAASQASSTEAARPSAACAETQPDQ